MAIIILDQYALVQSFGPSLGVDLLGVAAMDGERICSTLGWLRAGEDVRANVSGRPQIIWTLLSRQQPSRTDSRLLVHLDSLSWPSGGGVSVFAGWFLRPLDDKWNRSLRLIPGDIVRAHQRENFIRRHVANGRLVGSLQGSLLVGLAIDPHFWAQFVVPYSSERLGH